MKTCSVKGCNRRTLYRGYCSVHYERVKRHGDPSVGDRSGYIINSLRKCTAIECENPVYVKDLCQNHYSLLRKYGDLDFVKRLQSKRHEKKVGPNRKCGVEGCDGKYRTMGYCNKHYKKFLKYGDPLFSKLEWHHMRGTSEHTTWAGMVARCTDMNHIAYENYGGRGIKIYDRWRDSFIAFYEDMGPKPSPEYMIERKDNDGNYEPNNCIWTTPTEQVRNRRLNKNNSSGYAGVNYQNGKWLVTICVNYNKIRLGRFVDKSEAIKVRKDAELKYWGKA